MSSAWYRGKETTLEMLRSLARGGAGADAPLQAGAAWLCDFAMRYNPAAVESSGAGATATVGISREDELAKRRQAAKERAMAAMKAQMAKFAANIGDVEEDEDNKDKEDEDPGDVHMNEDVEGGGEPSSGRDDASAAPSFSTPVRRRSDSGIEGVEAIDLSPAGEFVLTSPIDARGMQSPMTPRTPHTPGTACSTPGVSTPQQACARLLSERPQCIICGADSDPMQLDDSDLMINAGHKSHDSQGKMPASSSSESESTREKALAFVGFAQASTVIMGGDGVPSQGPNVLSPAQNHVGVHITLCGHAIHKSCCDSYLKTVSQRDERLSDRLEGAKRREFRCPLCQRLSNCLLPFVDVGADWLDAPKHSTKSTMEITTTFKSDEGGMLVDRMNSRESMANADDSCSNGNRSLYDFLSTSKWWARNDKSVSWDGQCAFSERSDDTKPTSLSESSTASSPRRLSRRIHAPKFGKKELIGAWNTVLRTPRLVRRRARSLSAGAESGTRSPAIPTLGEPEQRPPSDVLRRFMDQVTDVAHRADARRLEENEFFDQEFRHYLSEKMAYNRTNRIAGKEVVDWPQCLTETSISEVRRQELSREKLISKLLFSIQAFTYTCCSEAAEVRQLLRDSPDKLSLFSKFGLAGASLEGDLLLLPEPDPSADDGQPFDGRMGKLRYLALSLMVATSPVAREVVQLCMSFPAELDPFDFEQDEKLSMKRYPVAYPLLCSHVLTHTVGCLVAVTGCARAEEGAYSIDSIVDDCFSFIQLGLIARVAQVIMASSRPNFEGDWEKQVYSIIEQNSIPCLEDRYAQEWRKFGISILQSLLRPAKSTCHSASFSHGPANGNRALSHILHSFELARTEALSFLRDMSLICQILIPNIFHNLTIEDSIKCDNPTVMLRRYMDLFQIRCLRDLTESDLAQDLITSWCADSTGKNPHLLDFPRIFQGKTWPVTSPFDRHNTTQFVEIPPTCLPLLGHCNIAKNGSSESPPRILYLPKSYTDLYAEISEMCPNIEQSALCLVCGQVLNAQGKAECTKHAYKCGGGAGIFFLVQECVGLIMHCQKAAYVHSPYVDFYGETPQYRGRPLNLDLDRYRILRSYWSGHLVRNQVAAERASTRQVIIANFY
ncbi:hypothetical protein ACHAWF_005616 [Thalassiosira exigua]